MVRNLFCYLKNGIHGCLIRGKKKTCLWKTNLRLSNYWIHSLPYPPVHRAPLFTSLDWNIVERQEDLSASFHDFIYDFLSLKFYCLSQKVVHQYCNLTYKSQCFIVKIFKSMQRWWALRISCSSKDNIEISTFWYTVVIQEKCTTIAILFQSFCAVWFPAQ